MHAKRITGAWTQSRPGRNSTWTSRQRPHAASECALRLAFVLVKTADAARGTVMVRIGAPTPVRTAQPKRPLSLR